MWTFGLSTAAVAKLPDPAVLSATIFKRLEDDPESEHRPKNPYCKLCQLCQKAKMLVPNARKRGGSTIIPKKFEDHVTLGHIVTKDLRDFGIEADRLLLW